MLQNSISKLLYKYKMESCKISGKSGNTSEGRTVTTVLETGY